MDRTDVRMRMAVVAGGAAVLAWFGVANEVRKHLEFRVLNPNEMVESQELFVQNNQRLIQLLTGDQSEEEIRQWMVRTYDLRARLEGVPKKLNDWFGNTWLEKAWKSFSGNEKIMHTSIVLTFKREETMVEIEYGPNGIISFVGGNPDRAPPVGTALMSIGSDGNEERKGKKRQKRDDTRAHTRYDIHNLLIVHSRTIGGKNYSPNSNNCNEFAHMLSMYLSNGCHNDEGLNRQVKHARGVAGNVVCAVGGAAQKVANTGACIGGAAWNNPMTAATLFLVAYYKLKV